jgi:hypothetical protein
MEEGEQQRGANDRGRQMAEGGRQQRGANSGGGRATEGGEWSRTAGSLKSRPLPVGMAGVITLQNPVHSREVKRKAMQSVTFLWHHRVKGKNTGDIEGH